MIRGGEEKEGTCSACNELLLNMELLEFFVEIEQKLIGGFKLKMAQLLIGRIRFCREQENKLLVSRIHS